MKKTRQEWQKELTAEQFEVCWNKGTERPFTGEYNQCNEPGVYRCVCCGHPLFSSESKFDAGCGWPSFFQPLDKEHVHEDLDESHGMRRVEVTCDNCGAHLGHVFPDGPAPGGLRYCINSVSLKLEQS